MTTFEFDGTSGYSSSRQDDLLAQSELTSFPPVYAPYTGVKITPPPPPALSDHQSGTALLLGANICSVNAAPSPSELVLLEQQHDQLQQRPKTYDPPLNITASNMSGRWFETFSKGSYVRRKHAREDRSQPRPIVREFIYIDANGVFDAANTSKQDLEFQFLDGSSTASKEVESLVVPGGAPAKSLVAKPTAPGLTDGQLLLELTGIEPLNNSNNSNGGRMRHAWKFATNYEPYHGKLLLIEMEYPARRQLCAYLSIGMWLLLFSVALITGAFMIHLDAELSVCCAPPTCAGTFQTMFAAGNVPRMTAGSYGMCTLQVPASNPASASASSSPGNSTSLYCNVTQTQLDACVLQMLRKRQQSTGCDGRPFTNIAAALTIAVGLVVYLGIGLHSSFPLRKKGTFRVRFQIVLMFGFILALPALVLSGVAVGEYTKPGFEINTNVKYNISKAAASSSNSTMTPTTTTNCTWYGQNPLRVLTAQSQGQVDSLYTILHVALIAHCFVWVFVFVMMLLVDPKPSLTDDEARSMLDQQVPFLLKAPSWHDPEWTAAHSGK